MKKSTLILMSFLLVSFSSFAQKTNDDDSKGSNYDENKNKPDNKTDDGNTLPADNPCLNTVAEITGILFGSYQSKLISNTYNNPSVNSFEIMLHGGVVTDGDESFLTAMPRIRLNSGALSGDIRYTFIDYGKLFIPGSILDVVADFNIVAGESFKMSLGQGFMYNLKQTENNIFHESFIGMDIAIMEAMILISPEFRLAYDWNISKPVNTELTLRGGYKLIHVSSFSIYANLAGAYQYMNPGLNRTIIYGGLDFYIR